MGKTTVAEKLSRHYQINHIKLKEVIKEKITQLVSESNDCQMSFIEEKIYCPLVVIKCNTAIPHLEID